MTKLKRILFLGIFHLLMLNLNSRIYPNEFRDPFYLAKPQKKNFQKSKSIKIIGIIKSAKIYSAILSIDGKEYVAFEGEKICNFIINNIRLNSVTFSNNKTQKTLFIKQ